MAPLRVTFFDAIQLGYQLSLAALTTCVVLTGSGPMKRTIATIFAAFVATWFVGGWWPSVEFAVAMIAADAAALLIITWHPAGKWQGVIGLSYLLQISVHIGRIANGNNADINSYWWGLSVTAILQLLLLGGWLIHERISRHHRGRDNPATSATRPKGAVR